MEHIEDELEDADAIRKECTEAKQRKTEATRTNGRRNSQGVHRGKVPP